jgi:hypothetical protein
MIADGFEVIERYLQELEALRYYARVRTENDSLLRQVDQLTKSAESQTAKAKSEASLNQKATSQLRKEEAEVKELSRKLGEVEAELSSIRNFQTKVLGTGGATLKEMKEQFLRAQASEIESKVKERARALELETHSRMPALIQEELRRVLASGDQPSEIRTIIDARARQLAEDMLRSNDTWPEWFRDYYLKQVNDSVTKGLAGEFDTKVKAEAQNKIEALKSSEWQRYVAAKAARLTTDLGSLLRELQGTWWFACDRCERRLGVAFGPSEVARLVGQGTVDVTCSSCLDPGVFPFFLNSVPHKVTVVSLQDLVLLYLGKTSN